MTSFFRGKHKKPGWRRKGRHEGFRIVGLKPEHVRRLSRKTGESYRVTCDRAGRWHVAFAARLLRLQRTAARQRVRGRPASSRLRGTYAAIARINVREADRRRDWVEKTSTSIARRFDVICVENLNVRGMTRSARGTAEEPGRNVACAFTANADVNAATNIAAGHAVTARGGRELLRPVNREPHPALLFA